jgi:hypothetical protein
VLTNTRGTEKWGLGTKRETTPEHMKPNLTTLLGQKRHWISKNSIKNAIVNTRNLAIKLFYLSLAFTLSACQLSGVKSLEINLLDIFLSMPEVDEDGEKIGLGEFQIIIEIKNSSNENYFLNFPTLLDANDNSINCYIRVTCENNEDMQLNLSYVTSSIVLMPIGKTDTVVLRSDFRDISKYYPKCFNENTINNIRYYDSPVCLNYQIKKDTQILVEGARYQLLNHYSGKLTLKK